ncbi:MAG: cytochrome c-type biogenesis protein CcmH [Gemmatimonadaceae bacterium]|nr:cytochrome c-type biogenesis protein CcmH [Gemmatimonadaceae bacterium]
MSLTDSSVDPIVDTIVVTTIDSTRRDLLRAGSFMAACVVFAPLLRAQSAAASAQGAANIEMSASAYKPVSLPRKPGAKPLVAQLDRDELERGLKCACPCKLDVFTCRTTDFACGISPAMHSDVVRLIAGGYSADEIVAAFTTVYGERVLMAPVKEGFNIAGYLVPFLTVGIGGTMLVSLLRRWKRETERATPAVVSNSVLPIGGSAPAGTDDELRRLQAAIRGDAPR